MRVFSFFLCHEEEKIYHLKLINVEAFNFGTNKKNKTGTKIKTQKVVVSFKEKKMLVNLTRHTLQWCEIRISIN